MWAGCHLASNPPGGSKRKRRGGGGEREACVVRSMLGWPRKEKKIEERNVGMKAHLGKLEKPGEVLLR